ncbi:MAG TPA: DUF4232 domain-containing protein [Streptosporangiaceae bacterium]
MNRSFLAAGRACAVAALISAASVVAACASQPTVGGAGTHTPTSQGPGGSGSATPTSSPSSPAPVTSSASPVGPHPCASRNLGVHTGNGEGAAGSTYIPIVFTNNSSATCTLYGYPGVSLAGGTPVRQIGVAADENPATPRQVVTLKPGGSASALLRIVSAQNYPAARCHLVHATYLQVYPPNQTTPIYAMYSGAACSKPVHLLTVDVVKPGTGS